MNKFISVKQFFLLFILLFICTNCMKEPVFRAPEEIKKVFLAKFPEHSDLEWSSQKGYIVADFRNKKGHHTRAWFSTGAEWVMTETRTISYSKLPEEIIKDNNIENIMSTSEVEFENIETRYVIKRIPINKPEFRFYRKKDRELFKTEHGAWENEPIIIPPLALKQIKSYSDTLEIIDGQEKNDMLKLHAVQKKHHKFLCFKTTGEWVTDYHVIKEESKEHKKLKQLIAEKFPAIANFSAFFIEYPKETITEEMPQEAYYIITDERSFFINSDGEELDNISQEIEIALADLT